MRSHSATASSRESGEVSVEPQLIREGALLQNNIFHMDVVGRQPAHKVFHARNEVADCGHIGTEAGEESD